VKADGYGHGLAPVARALDEAGAYGFAVAWFQEALDLRAAGLTRMILHMGRFDPADLAAYDREQVRLTIHDIEDLRRLAAHRKEQGAKFIAHLKVDTGMGRLGVSYEDAVTVLEEIKGHPFIQLEGIYSHFSTSDEEDHSYMRYQLVRFGQFVHVARKLGLDVPFFHIANSGAVIQETESYFNMVRTGLLLYGVCPSKHVKPPFAIQPVMDLKAPLVLIKDLKRGSPVGYSRAYRAPADTRIGVLQIGYADAAPMGLSGKGVVQIGGAVAPVLGRVSMDLCAIELPQGEFSPGDEALIWGLSEDPRLSVEYQADLSGTIPYELLVRLGNRVERQYVED